MAEETYFASYADGKKLKKLTPSDLSKAQRAYIISLPTSAPESIKRFMSEFFPDYYAHYCEVSIIEVLFFSKLKLVYVYVICTLIDS